MKERYRITAVVRVATVLKALAERPGATLTEVARLAELTEPTTLRYLANLVAQGLAERGDDGRYRLGLRVFQLGQRALEGRDVQRVARPLMDTLVERFGETTNLGVRQGDDLVLIEALESRQSIRKGASVGETDVWHATGLGKALLAQMPLEEARSLLVRQGLPRYTDNTLADLPALEAELQAIRERGYATDMDESEYGVRCAAAAVFDASGEAVYGLSVSGPSSRLTTDVVAQIGEAVAETARLLSAELGFLEPKARAATAVTD
jgi:IclR family acetate operon transcriptional repressor